MQRTLKTSKKKNKKKNVSRPRMDEKKLHTWEFQLKGILRNMKYKLLPKKFYWKNSRVFQMLAIYFHWKDIFTELNRYIFQISLKYIKLVIPKICLPPTSLAMLFLHLDFCSAFSNFFIFAVFCIASFVTPYSLCLSFVHFLKFVYWSLTLFFCLWHTFCRLFCDCLYFLSVIRTCCSLLNDSLRIL